MANRYWVGGSAIWDATAGSKWALTSGGAGGQAVPTSSDDVFFDAASGAVTVTQSINRDCLSLDFTGFTGSFVSSDPYNATLNIYGNLTLGSGMTLDDQSVYFVFKATSSKTITTNGKALGRFSFNGVGGTWVLQDNFTSLTGATSGLDAGTLDLNNKNFTTTIFGLSGTSARGLVMGSGTFSITSDYWDASDTTNLTFTKGTGTIKYTDSTNSNKSFFGGGLTYNNIWFARGASTGSITITGTNTFADFKDTGTVAHTIIFPNVTTTFTTFTVSGSVGKLITLSRTGGSGTFTLSKASGNVFSEYLFISNSVATGGAAWYATYSTDNGNNTGWLFTVPWRPATKNVSSFAYSSETTSSWANTLKS